MNDQIQDIAYRLNTRSGVVIDARAAEPGDETALEAFFDKVSDEDRRFRFLTAHRHVGHEQLKPMVEVDHFRSETFLAFDDANNELVATGMLACDNDLDTAEVAISVRADYKGKGVAWAVLGLLAEEAKKRGVREVISIEDRDNHEAIALERERGFVPRACEGDAHLVILAKTLR
ncbi:GNAT family N-acetyltransferase [Altererythrobacter sp. FM1]|uniref:GNAT family N-acetyltransferase n=1 Tax=Tsuneonella flava TaxID=2055955 RepID=A0ABX7K9K2_9SPHN|nr:GNAT family N-acetyltransferase [Tsuneonella flava]QSB43756.1 GNAT family N-acetyltransferase [Tsuneonella flava]ROT95662.1 GNAT family N-acetyltransferase [Altererythrobacter sp. FM1]